MYLQFHGFHLEWLFCRYGICGSCLQALELFLQLSLKICLVHSFTYQKFHSVVFISLSTCTTKLQVVWFCSISKLFVPKSEVAYLFLPAGLTESAFPLYTWPLSSFMAVSTWSSLKNRTKLIENKYIPWITYNTKRKQLYINRCILDTKTSCYLMENTG